MPQTRCQAQANAAISDTGATPVTGVRFNLLTGYNALSHQSQKTSPATPGGPLAPPITASGQAPHDPSITPSAPWPISRHKHDRYSSLPHQQQREQGPLPRAGRIRAAKASEPVPRMSRGQLRK